VPAQVSKQAIRREVPPIVIYVVVAILVIGLGVGVYYAYNGGWKTTAMQDDYYTHNVLPLQAAKRGDRTALDAENKLRKEQGRPLLVPQAQVKRPVTDEARRLADQYRQKALAAQGGR
jgi:hypothetical protein